MTEAGNSIAFLVGKRLLLRVQRSDYMTHAITEYLVLEVSPSGNWVKLRDLHGTPFWVATGNIAVVEELRDMRAERLAEREGLNIADGDMNR